MQRIVAADIGGTNCRLGLFKHQAGNIELEKVLWIDTAGIGTTEEFLKAVETHLQHPLKDSDVLVTAIAGPVEDRSRGFLSNGNLHLDFSPYMHREDQPRMVLVNDFLAQAYAVLSPQGAGARKIAGPDSAPPFARRSVIGAGTGLGNASMIWVGANHSNFGAWLPLASENGWVAFPFMSDQEHDYHKFLREKLSVPYATGDDVVTGRGLAALHEYLTGEALSPAEVGQKALGSDTDTLIWYSRFYARAVRNWMLSTLCTGGIWIAGGIAARNPYVVDNKYFIEELYASPKWESFLKTIPVRFMEDKNSGLWGTAQLGQELLEVEGS